MPYEGVCLLRGMPYEGFDCIIIIYLLSRTQFPLVYIAKLHVDNLNCPRISPSRLP